MERMNGSKMKPTQTISFFETTNPEVFKIEPRAGGIVPVEHLMSKDQLANRSKDRTLKKSECPALQEKVSREFRVRVALDESMSAGSLLEEPNLPNPLGDSMYMLSVVVSTVVLLAAKFPDIPQIYLDWTEDYLECIKDENGHHPPNVQGLLNHLKCVKNGTLPADDDGGEGPGGDGAGPSGERPNESEEAEMTVDGDEGAADGGDGGEETAADAGEVPSEGEDAEAPEDEAVAPPDEAMAPPDDAVVPPDEAIAPPDEAVSQGEEGEKTIVSVTRIRMSTSSQPAEPAPQ